MDVPFWFGHVVAWVCNCAPVDVELIFIEIRLEGAQRHGPDALRILRHLGGRGPLVFVDTALNANKYLHVVGLWCQEPELDGSVG